MAPVREHFTITASVDACSQRLSLRTMCGPETLLIAVDFPMKVHPTDRKAVALDPTIHSIMKFIKLLLVIALFACAHGRRVLHNRKA